MTTYLLSVSIAGCILSVIAVFLFCFFYVHVARLAKLGWTYRKNARKPAPSPPKPKEKPAPTEKQAVYYIVERKRGRNGRKDSYSPPQRIQFK